MFGKMMDTKAERARIVGAIFLLAFGMIMGIPILYMGWKMVLPAIIADVLASVLITKAVHWINKGA